MRESVASVGDWQELKRELRQEDARAVRSGERRSQDVKKENEHFVSVPFRLRLDPSRL